MNRKKEVTFERIRHLQYTVNLGFYSVLIHTRNLRPSLGVLLTKLEAQLGLWYVS